MKILAVVAVSIVFLGLPGASHAKHPVGRACCLAGNWYERTSAWNTPIPRRPPLAANSNSLIAAFNSRWCTNAACLVPTAVSVPSVWIASSTTPLVTVQINYPSCNARQVRVPIPAGASASASSDPEPTMAIMVPESGVEWDFFKLTPPGARPLSSGPVCSASSNWAATVVVRAQPGWTGPGNSRGAPRASQTLLGSGLIRPRDAKAPPGSTWEHAIALAYPGTLAGAHAWPALSSDGRCADASSCLPMGARVQLDPSIDCSKWPGVSSEWQRQLCRTLQKYGMIVIDTGAALEAQNPVSTGGYTYPWASNLRQLPSDLATHLRVIDWTRWTGRGRR